MLEIAEREPSTDGGWTTVQHKSRQVRFTTNKELTMPTIITKNKDAGIATSSMTNAVKMVDHGHDKLASRKTIRECNKSEQEGNG